MSRKQPESRTQTDLIRAAEDAEQRIRGLQNRLAACGAAGSEEASEDLDAELRKYFAVEAAAADLRNRVVEKVAERILESWSQESLVEELAEKILERILAGAYTPPAGSRKNS